MNCRFFWHVEMFQLQATSSSWTFSSTQFGICWQINALQVAAYVCCSCRFYFDTLSYSLINTVECEKDLMLGKIVWKH